MFVRCNLYLPKRLVITTRYEIFILLVLLFLGILSWTLKNPFKKKSHYLEIHMQICKYWLGFLSLPTISKSSGFTLLFFNMVSINNDFRC